MSAVELDGRKALVESTGMTMRPGPHARGGQPYTRGSAPALARQGRRTDATLTELLMRQPALFRRLYRFNYLPADYLHPELRDEFVPSVVNPMVWSEPRARSALSTLILQKLGLQQRSCMDATLKAWPVVLLDHTRLLRLARHVGAVLLGPRVRSSVSREAVLAWKERLTPPVYQFVMHSASLLPQVKSGAAIADDTPVEALGYGWIARSISDAPDELLLRAQLKFPKAAVTPLTVGQARAAQVVMAVSSTLEPRWISSFATPRR